MKLLIKLLIINTFRVVKGVPESDIAALQTRRSDSGTDYPYYIIHVSEIYYFQ